MGFECFYSVFFISAGLVGTSFFASGLLNVALGSGSYPASSGYTIGGIVSVILVLIGFLNLNIDDGSACFTPLHRIECASVAMGCFLFIVCTFAAASLEMDPTFPSEFSDAFFLLIRNVGAAFVVGGFILALSRGKKMNDRQVAAENRMGLSCRGNNGKA